LLGVFFVKRLNYIDGLKGWCAASVCLLHFFLMFAVNVGASLLLTAVSAKTITPLTNYTCKRVGSLLG
jgi:peptidoglycan/LPS O-acetylase OafA/YrhL